MATDILIYQADLVPVGQDQVAHVEVTREVARRFNHFYPGPGEPILPEPQVLLTPSPKLPERMVARCRKAMATLPPHRPEPVVR